MEEWKIQNTEPGVKSKKARLGLSAGKLVACEKRWQRCLYGNYHKNIHKHAFSPLRAITRIKTNKKNPQDSTHVLFVDLNLNGGLKLVLSLGAPVQKLDLPADHSN